MNQEQAKRLIKNTFENAFDRERFIHFSRELLNHMEQDSFHYHGCYLPETYRPYIKSIERIGKYNDGDNRIDVLIVNLQKETSLIHARTMQRNFIAGYLQGKYGSASTKEAALVACVSPDPADWRFSLVKMDYDFKKTPAGNPKIVTEFSPAKRWSFLVGENEQSHTAQIQLVKHIADDEQDPKLTQLEEAFNIETVTIEFFLEYRNLFIRTKEALDQIVKENPDVKSEFESQGVNTVDFAKKLLGQIVFLYFLQKKGWFGVGRDDSWGTGSKIFLRELFNKKHGTYNNFFNDILEHLFYDALRNDRSYNDNYYSRFNCKIPFLNGGLFDPIGNYKWVHVDINLPDSLFSNNRPTKQGDVDNGILDIFDRYNFTVREDEPLEKEVAIDPELLGKAYEKFNAIRPENFEEYKKVLDSGQKGSENKFNKQYGVYYTPREIVHYMCQQSLIHYLESELNGKTVSYERVGKSNLDIFGNEARKGQLDITIEHKEIPTIPKEDIEKFIQLGEHFKENDEVALIKEEEMKNGNQQSSTIEPLLPKTIGENAAIIDEKLENIAICDPAVGSGAFPVGMMNEIVKARTVLSLYLKDDSRNTYNFKRQCIEKSLYGVDIDPGAVEIAKLRLWLSLIVEEEDFKNIKPLPNLDYKIMQGNSLISEFMGINFDTDLENNKYSEILFEDEKKTVYETLKTKKEELINQTDVNKKILLRKEIEDLIINLFEIKLKKQKADYFKQLEDIEEKYKNHPVKDEREREINIEKDKLFTRTGFNLDKIEKQLREYTNSRIIRPFFLWNLYFSEVFQEKNGFDVVIANPPYVRQEKIRDQKELLSKQDYEIYNSTSDIYTYFYERSYKILKSVGIFCFISSNKWLRAKYGIKLREFLKEKTSIEQIIDFNGYKVFEATIDTNIFIFKKKKPVDNTFDILNIQSSYNSKVDLGIYFKKHFFKMKQLKLSSRCFTFEDGKTMNLKEKIEKNGEPLESWSLKIFFGIKTGFNKAFIIDNKTKINICNEDPNSIKIIKPILRGRDIKKYYYIWDCIWLIKIESGWTDKNRDKSKPEEFFKKSYPAVYSYLKSFKNDKGKGKGLINRDDQGDYWWELRDCDYYSEIENTKIIYPDIARNLSFSLDVKGNYINNTAYFINTGNKFLLAILNSKLINFYYKTISSQLGKEALRGFTVFISQLPIPKVSQNKQQPFICLVDKIMENNKDIENFKNPEKTFRLKGYEKQIDQMVYKLYNLNEEEIEIVEKNLND